MVHHCNCCNILCLREICLIFGELTISIVLFFLLVKSIPQRYVLAVMSSLAIIAIYMTRVVLAISMTQMVKKLVTNQTVTTDEISCPMPHIDDNVHRNVSGVIIDGFTVGV